MFQIVSSYVKNLATWALNLFDRLHLGHQIMIDRLVEEDDPIAVVTDGELVGQDIELKAIIQPLDVRVNRLRQYLRECRLEDIVDVRTATRKDEPLTIKESLTFVMYEGPCCTEIQSGALDLRKQELGVEDTIEFLKPVRANDGDKIASARIRRGDIDRLGHRLKGTIEPPRHLQLEGRRELTRPKGDLYRRSECVPEKAVVKRILDEEPELVITVGDVTTATVLDEGYTPRVMLVDGITKRGPFEREFTAENQFLIYNPAAVIYPEAWSTIATAIAHKKSTLISVDGEEDLLGFPAVLLAPEGSVILYGQPNEGIVWVPVNAENRKLARTLLEQMPVIR